jgi:isochorismate synthase
LTETEIYSKAKKSINQQKPFVLFRKPNDLNLYALYQSNTDHYFYDFSGASGFVMAPFDSKNKILFIPEEKAIFVKAPIITNENSGNKRVKEHSEKNNISEATTYKKLVQKAISTIKSKQLVKVVVSRKEKVPFRATFQEVFQVMAQMYPSAFCYLWYHPFSGIWLGATPEILLTYQDEKFTTMALAGTRKAAETPSEAWEQKELKEQGLVTEAIVKILKKYTPDIRIDGPVTSRAANIEHLRTKISGILPFNSLDELISDLHPTPAVCGTPREKAKAFILENENYDREFYTGYLGFIHQTEPENQSANTALYVNLRCMKLSESDAFIFVGGGITEESDPSAEWIETINKSKTMKQVLLNIT